MQKLHSITSPQPSPEQAKWHRTRRNKTIVAGIFAVAALSGASRVDLSSTQHRIDALWQEETLQPKPANIYDSQSAFAALQRQADGVQAKTHDVQIAMYFQYAAIESDEPMARMREAASQLKRLYSPTGGEVNYELKEAEPAINRAAGIHIRPEPAGAALMELYAHGSSAPLTNLGIDAQMLQASTNSAITISFITTMVYYKVNDNSSLMAGFVSDLANNTNIHHDDISDKQEIKINTKIAQESITNLALLSASGGGINEITYYPFSSSTQLFKDTQNAVHRIRERNRKLIIASLVLSAVFVLYMGAKGYGLVQDVKSYIKKARDAHP